MFLTRNMILGGLSIILIAGLTLGYTLKNLTQNSRVEGVSTNITPTSDPSPSLTSTPTPSLTPIPTKRPVPSHTPTKIPTPTSIQSQDTLDKTTLNDYMACKSACPKVKGESSCTPNENGRSSNCTVSQPHSDPVCIDACKSKYGLTF